MSSSNSSIDVGSSGTTGLPAVSVIVAEVRLTNVLLTLVAIEVLDFRAFKFGVVRVMIISVPSNDCVDPPVNCTLSLIEVLLL